MKQYRMIAMLLAICLAVFSVGMTALADSPETKPGDEAIPKSTDTEMKEEPETTDDSLMFAVDVENEAEDAVFLDAEKLCDRFGEDLIVMSASVKYDETKPTAGMIVARYDEIKPADGMIEMKADGTRQYLTIENKRRRVLWAGLFEGHTDKAPGAILNYEYMEADGELTEDAEKELIVDVTGIIEEYGEGVEVHHGSKESNYTLTTELEDGVWSVPIDGEGKYILIVTNDLGIDNACLWGGYVEEMESKAGGRLVFRVCPQETASAEEIEIKITLADVYLKGGVAYIESNTALDALDGLIEIGYTYLDEEGEFLTDAEQMDKAPEISQVGNYDLIYEAPKEAAVVRLSVYYRGLKVAEAEKEITPPELNVPDILLNHETPERTGESVTFSGSIFIGSSNGELEEWSFYIDGEKLQPKIEKLEDGEAEFVFEEYPCEAGKNSVSVCVRHNVKAELQSGEFILSVPNPVLTVQVEGYENYYDGQPHTVTIQPEDGGEVLISHALTTDEETVPGADAWIEGVPEYTDKINQTLYIRVEREGYDVQYQDAAGNTLEAVDGAVKAEICILPPELIVMIWAEQDGEVIYTGMEQEASFLYYAEIEGDEEGLVDKILASEAWKQSGSMKVKDSGAQSIEPEEGQFDFLETLDGNYTLRAKWQPSEVIVSRKPVELSSRSYCGVYDHSGKGITVANEKVEGTEALSRTGDYFNGNIIAGGSQAEAGVGRNTIQLSGKFAERQANYEVTLNEGALVVFPQSLNAEDPAWDKQKSLIDPEDYRDAERGELPAYYNGIQAELREKSGKYNSMDHDIEICFRDRQESLMRLEEGTDYEVVYLRGGAETDDLLSAGTIEVRICGKGNYGGEVSLEYTIEKMSVDAQTVALESWVYDGACAGSENHLPAVEYTGAAPEFVYRDAEGNVIDAPCDAGVYTVCAVWKETGNISVPESEPCQFEIMPAEVRIIVSDRQIVKVEDESDQFNKSMIEITENGYICRNKNFRVEFEVDGRIQRDASLPPVSVQLEGWMYDGEAAGSDAHQPTLTNIEGEVEYRYFDEADQEISAPSDAGTYRLTAAWNNGADSVETEFVIRPMEITIRAEDAVKVYGEEDPALNAVVSGEAVLEELVFAVQREGGEDAGAYPITPIGETAQGNYAITYEPGVLTIQPKPLEGIRVTLVSGMDPIVFDGQNCLLENGTDYTAQIGEGTDEVQVTISGMGNYAGEVTQSCSVLTADYTVEMMNADGQSLSQKGLPVGADGTISLTGRIEGVMPFEAESAHICINGEKVDAVISQTKDTVCGFALRDAKISEDKPDSIELSVWIDGEEQAVQTIPLDYAFERMIWITVAAVMTLGAILCSLNCMKLRKRLKKERMKLLDSASYQSSRTIRDGRD